MPILIISKKYAKIRKFETKISPPICTLWGKIFLQNFLFLLYILYSNLERWEKQKYFWWIRLRVQITRIEFLGNSGAKLCLAQSPNWVRYFWSQIVFGSTLYMQQRSDYIGTDQTVVNTLALLCGNNRDKHEHSSN